MIVDDGILGSHGEGNTAEQANLVRFDLEAAGFTLNEEKSVVWPLGHLVTWFS